MSNYKILCDNSCTIGLKILDLQSENIISNQNDKTRIDIRIHNHTNI